ncbi:MAG: hypothetical protein HY521_03820 [Proteobacteria bacterium]|nr:hypothetical protein [Pseudomonadota bacterium]
MREPPRRRPREPMLPAADAPADRDEDRARRFAAMEALAARRRLIVPAPNPSTGVDYIVSLEGELKVRALPAPVAVTLRYVPDREVLPPASLATYFAALGEAAWASLEELAVALLTDLSNELVPRWLEVVVTAELPGADASRIHRVILQDRQPRWDNRWLIGRLAAV